MSVSTDSPSTPLAGNVGDSAGPPTQSAPPVVFNPFDPAFQQDPYSFYAQAHATGVSVVKHPLGVYFVIGYDAAANLLKHSQTSKDFERTEPGKMMLSINGDAMANSVFNAERRRWVLQLDGAEHQRIRSLIAKAFNRRAVDALEPHIHDVVDRLLEQPLASGRVELISEIALPLPTTIICELLKLPHAIRERTDEWSVHITKTFDLFVTPDIYAAGDKAMTEFVEAMTELVAHRRQHPEDGLIDAFIAVEEEGDRLSTAEVISNSIFLFGAGHETTTNLIGNGLHALIEHPDQFKKLRDQPDLIDSALDEMLRYNSPVQMTTRTTTADIDVEGTVIPANSLVAVMLGAGNRDPRIFSDPHTLKLDRSEAKPLSFGGGAHYCIGAMLAKMEARIFFETLLARTESVEFADAVHTWRNATNLRGLEALQLKLG